MGKKAQKEKEEAKARRGKQHMTESGDDDKSLDHQLNVGGEMSSFSRHFVCLLFGGFCIARWAVYIISV